MYRGRLTDTADQRHDRDVLDPHRKDSTFTSAGITIQVDNKKYTYEVLDMDGMLTWNLAQAHEQGLYVMYDLSLTRVRLYERLPRYPLRGRAVLPLDHVTSRSRNPRHGSSGIRISSTSRSALTVRWRRKWTTASPDSTG